MKIPRVIHQSKDYTKFPWTEDFRTKFPTVVAAKFVNSDTTVDDMRDFLFVEKHMDYRKASILAQVYSGERGIVRNDSDVLLEICVPICDNQCSNCVRTVYKRSNKWFRSYFDCLLREIRETCNMIRKKGYFVKAVCFTGNLLVFDAAELEQIFAHIAFPLCEICIEVSDMLNITREKLDVIKKLANVRFILNALTFNMVTLRTIHKHFELREIRPRMELLVEYGFDLSIRLAVGLQKERCLQLMRNIKIAMSYEVNCIDLYSRCCCKNEIAPLDAEKKIAMQREMHEMINEYLLGQKFEPYFLYCSEVENGCFENVGFCRPGKKCKYVEDRMYEVSTVIGCGVCAESIIVKNLPKSRRKYQNTSDFAKYITDIDAIISQKITFFG